jgi:hypothetical protein
MGYDLHISKVQDLSEREQFPISLREFCAAVADRPGWSVITGVDPEYTSQGAGFDFADPASVEGSFTATWHDGKVTVSNPASAAIPELVAVADLLDAMVVGDYFERYFADGSRVDFE